MLRLAPFFEGLCREFYDTRDNLPPIAAEQLVYGMNLDEDWRRNHMSPERHRELNFALGLVAGKDACISNFSTNSVTAFIASEEEAGRLLMVPGRN
jgi:hypothetical protein